MCLSVQSFSRVSLQPHEPQHARLPCPSPTPRAYSNSCPLSWWCHPAISSSVTPPPALNPSQHWGLFKWVSSSHQVAKLLEFQLQDQSFQWIFRIDFFRIDWLDLLDVQGTLKSLLQQHNLKASILQVSAFFTVLRCLGGVRCIAACFVWIISLTLSNNPSS